MPMVFGSLERWFRTQKEDFFEIVLAEGEGISDIRPDLIAWIAEKMPHRSIVILEGSERHGLWMAGSPGRKRRMHGLGVDSQHAEEFTLRSLGFRDPDRYWQLMRQFVRDSLERGERILACTDAPPMIPRFTSSQLNEPATLETRSQLGELAAPETRFKSMGWRYQDWLNRFGRIQTGAGLPPEGAPFRWLLCNEGVFWLRGVYVGTAYVRYAGAPCFDDWWIVRQRFPELRIGDDEVFLMGTCRVDGWGTCRMEIASYRQADGDVGYDLEGFEFAELHVARARKALTIPDDAVVTFGWH